MSALHDVLAAEGGLLADALGDRDAPSDRVAETAAAGPRAAADPAAYALLVAAVREGHRLHAGAAAVVTRADPDLALLAGDRLYALGLDRLARLGDLAAVRELADAISLCALAQADAGPDLAQAAWEGAAVAIGWGAGSEHAGAKEAARAGDPAAPAALRAAAAAARAQAGASTGRKPERG